MFPICFDSNHLQKHLRREVGCHGVGAVAAAADAYLNATRTQPVASFVSNMRRDAICHTVFFVCVAVFGLFLICLSIVFCQRFYVQVTRIQLVLPVFVFINEKIYNKTFQSIVFFFHA